MRFSKSANNRSKLNRESKKRRKGRRMSSITSLLKPTRASKSHWLVAAVAWAARILSSR